MQDATHQPVGFSFQVDGDPRRGVSGIVCQLNVAGSQYNNSPGDTTMQTVASCEEHRTDMAPISEKGV